MAKSGTYAGYEGLEPFFDVIQEGLKGLVQGERFFGHDRRGRRCKAMRR